MTSEMRLKICLFYREFRNYLMRIESKQTNKQNHHQKNFLPIFYQYVQDYQPWLLLLLQAQEAHFHQQNCCQSLEKPRTGSCELMSRSGVRFLPKKFAQLLFMCTLWQNREIYTTKPLVIFHMCTLWQNRESYSTKPVMSHAYPKNKWLGAPVWPSPFNRLDLRTGCMNHKNIRVLFSLCAASNALLNTFYSGCYLLCSRHSFQEFTWTVDYCISHLQLKLRSQV